MGFCGGCSAFGKFRRSSVLIIIVVCCCLLTDSLLLTLVDPILPDMLRKLGNTSAMQNGDYTLGINTNGKYGFLVAAKGATQFAFNPFVGCFIANFGYRRPMIIGSIFLCASTIVFAFGQSYEVFFVSRMIQGAASSLTAVTGMGLVASTFTDDTERGTVMGYAIGGLSMGIIVGPIYGSILYQFCGQSVPFLVLSGMVFVSFVLQVLGYKEEKGVQDHSMKTICYLIMDPYILIVAGNIFLLNLDVSVILAFLPVRLIELSNPDTWQLGIVVLPTSVGYLMAGLIFPRTAKWFKRWLCALVGLLISTATLIALAYSTGFISMLIVTTFLGLALVFPLWYFVVIIYPSFVLFCVSYMYYACKYMCWRSPKLVLSRRLHERTVHAGYFARNISPPIFVLQSQVLSLALARANVGHVGVLLLNTRMVSSSMQPIFALLVDIRHSSIYGNVYAISDMAVCLAMFLGPLAGGPIYYSFGYKWLLYGIAILNLAFSQLCVLLRNPPRKNQPSQDRDVLSEKGEFTPLIGESNRSRANSISSAKSYTSVSSIRSRMSEMSRPSTARYPEMLTGYEHLFTEDPNLTLDFSI